MLLDDGDTFGPSWRADFFEGDLYAEEPAVTRGLRLSAPADAHVWGKDAGWKEHLDEPRLLLAGEPCCLPVVDLGLGLAVVAPSSPAAFAEALQGFLGSLDAVVQVDAAAGTLRADICEGYELLRLRARLVAPRGQRAGVAALFQREDGDGVAFLQTVRRCTEFLRAAGLGAEQVCGQAEAQAAAPCVDVPHSDVTPPASPSGSLPCFPQLSVAPCDAADLEPLVALGLDADPRARVEAVVMMNKILDDSPDADALTAVLSSREEVVLGWVADAECSLCGPALGRKLHARSALAAPSLVPALLRALPRAPPLGARQVARALAEVLAETSDQAPEWKAQLAEALLAIPKPECSDAAAQRYLAEAQIALR